MGLDVLAIWAALTISMRSGKVREILTLWPAALELTLAQFADPAHADLKPEAAIRLANIFAALEDPSFRADVLDAIRSHPAALPLLKKFLQASSSDRTHPLRFLASYLNDQLNLKAIAAN